MLTLLCIFVPLSLSTDRATLKGSGPLLLFFAGIGLGFMLVETSQMQRLIVVLGHPTYGLTVVLFTLLLAGGAGSYLTNRVTQRHGGAGGCAADGAAAGAAAGVRLAHARSWPNACKRPKHR